MTRREWIQKLALLSAGVCTCCGKAASTAPPASNCCFTPDLEPECLTVGDRTIRVDLSKTTLLRRPASAANLIVPERNLQIIIVRLRKRHYVALSRLCTHAAQVLSFVEERGLLQCNGFNHSTFALDGQVIKGPAEKRLKTYAVRLEKDFLDINTAERRGA